jgi:hypothetical protein
MKKKKKTEVPIAVYDPAAVPIAVYDPAAVPIAAEVWKIVDRKS